MGNFFKGLLLGGICGGIAGLLLAPRPGKETQKIVKSTIKEYTDTISDITTSSENAQEALSRITTEGLDLANQFFQEVSQSIETFKEDNQPTFNRIQHAVGKIQEDIGVEEIVKALE